MSETTSYLLQTLRDRLRDLELDAVAVRSRIEEIRELIQMLEGNPKRRPGRPAKPVTVVGLKPHELFDGDDDPQPPPEAAQ